MAAGKELKPLGFRQRRRLAHAVDEAEEFTGLQICVYLAAIEGEDSRARAEELFVKNGLDARPAVLVLVAPPQHKVEVVTAPSVQDRVSDDDAAVAVAAMVGRFKEGDLAGGLVDGVKKLAEAAGAGVAHPDDVELPDVLGG